LRCQPQQGQYRNSNLDVVVASQQEQQQLQQRLHLDSNPAVDGVGTAAASNCSAGWHRSKTASAAAAAAAATPAAALQTHFSSIVEK
jgi:hypothetical protein